MSSHYSKERKVAKINLFPEFLTANVKHFGIISSIMEGGFPFEIKQPRYNKETKAAILEARSISSGEIKARRLAEEI